MDRKKTIRLMVDDWLHAVERQLDIAQCNDQERVLYVAGQLREVAEDGDKQEHFLESLNDNLHLQLMNNNFNNFNHLVDHALLTEQKRKEIEEKKKKLNPDSSNSNTVGGS
ncbi:hypothetical protein U9M48_042717 [Paspalum notatum var. saurae]|uniref:Uncharacterized protein n=1 Tax=Paspalum notatum var. saurae TaxID=547442 RepID=A0AAQ3UVD7_PASNO